MKLITIAIAAADCGVLAELLNYGEAAIGHPSLVKRIKDEMIKGLTAETVNLTVEVKLASEDDIRDIKAKPTRKPMSEAGRRAIQAAQKKRWAKHKKG